MTKRTTKNTKNVSSTKKSTTSSSKSSKTVKSAAKITKKAPVKKVETKSKKKNETLIKLLGYAKNVNPRVTMAIIFVFGVLLIFSSYAWFSMNLNIKIKTFNMVVAKNSDLTIEEQVDKIVFNNGLSGNEGGATYGIPTEMTNTSPTSYSQDVIYSSPLLRWDLYTGVGSPDIKDLDGLLDTLEDMKEKYPTNADGDAAYPFSLWADWDGGDGMLGIANVVQLTTWYGEKIKGSAILKPDDTFTPLTDKTASYYKILKFLNDAYLAGIVDPDSGTQNWDSACAKMSAGQVYLMWYSWQTGFWNRAVIASCT